MAEKKTWQRMQIWLFVALVFAGGAAGGMGWRYIDALLSMPPVATQAQLVLTQFRWQHPTKKGISWPLLESLWPASLLRPDTLLPQSHKHPYIAMQALLRAQSTCTFKATQTPLSPALQKAMRWHRFLCGQQKQLPATFFQRPPYLHPLGGSYVMRALTSRKSIFRKRVWIERHQYFAHVLEWRLLRRWLQAIPTRLAPILMLTRHTLARIQGAAPIVTTKNHLFLRRRPTPKTQALVYYVYPLSLLRQFAYTRGLLLWRTDARQTTCTVRTELLCWARIKAPWWARLGWGLVLGGSFAIAMLWLGVGLSRRFRREAQAQERQQLMIQTLTHELRTPLTGMQLTLDQMRQELAQQPANQQESFLRLCQQHQTLKRLMVASQQYLQSQPGALQLQTLHIESCDAFFGPWIDSYQQQYPQRQLQYKRLKPDAAIDIDPYWLGLCLRNLVDNAFCHGKEPVIVQLTRQDEHLHIAIIDQGQGPTMPLHSLATPFLRGPGSEGMGLGLAITQQVLTIIGAELHMSKTPTTFCIQLKAFS